MARKPPIPDYILENARRLRRDQTDAERLLWHLLRNRAFGGFKFRRQHPLAGYILDFYCHERRLAIELDGGQHVMNTQKDSARDDDLKQQGIVTLRFWNNELFENTAAVVELIWRKLHR